VDDVPIRLISEKENIRILELDKQKGIRSPVQSGKFDGDDDLSQAKE